MEAKSWFDANAGLLGFVGLVVTVVAIGLAIWWRPRQSKMLGWKYESANQIIRMSPMQRHGMPLKVVYGAHDVDNPNIIVLRISNAGRTEIRIDDFDQPITVEFKHSKLLALAVINQSSPSMTITFKSDTSAPNRVTLNPLLLNAGEWIELQFITDGAIERPRVEARIVGQTREPASLAVVQIKRTKRVLVSLWFFLFITGAVSFSFVLSQSYGIGKLAVIVVVGVLFGLLGSSFKVRYVGLPRISRRRRTNRHA